MNTLFWTDKWLHGHSLDRLMPHLFAAVSGRGKKRSVAEALTDMRWVEDIRGASTVFVLFEQHFLEHFLSEIVLQPDVVDSHIWQFSTTGRYSAKSAYEAVFIGSTHFNPWERIWKSWAPGNANFLCGWLPITSAGQRTG